MSVTPRSDQGRAAEVAVTVIASETTTTRAASKIFPNSGVSIEEDLRYRAETVTMILEKIIQVPPPSSRWGINE